MAHQSFIPANAPSRLPYPQTPFASLNQSPALPTSNMPPKRAKRSSTNVRLASALCMCRSFPFRSRRQTICAATAQRRVSPRAQFLRSQGLPSWAQLPSHFPTSPTVHAVERLRRLPAFPSHCRPLPIRAVESFCRPEVLGPVVQVRRLILLLVAHDAFPFPSPSKNRFRSRPSDPCAH
jgi:hypothetical protein